MALRSTSRPNIEFSMSSMSDLVFLLLIFFMLTSTLISPNALKLLLPQSNNQTQSKQHIAVSITPDLRYFISVDGKQTQVPFTSLEGRLQDQLKFRVEPTISLHADKSVPVEYVVKVMNIARNNKYKVILATAPEQ
jgi:biopolymer transport protein ExbD